MTLSAASNNRVTLNIEMEGCGRKQSRFIMHIIKLSCRSVFLSTVSRNSSFVPDEHPHTGGRSTKLNKNCMLLRFAK